MFPFDQADLLAEMIGDIELAAIIHFAVLGGPCGERVARERNPRRSIGIACNSGEAKLGSIAALERVIPDLPIA